MSLELCEAAEAAVGLFGWDLDPSDFDDEYEFVEEVDDTLYQNFEMTLDSFSTVLDAVTRKLDFALSPLTNTAYVGIGAGGTWLVRKDVDSSFLGGIIQWATEGEEIPEDVKVFTRIITCAGKPAYKISIEKVDE